ncbi:hypothetical protein [Brevibacillus thermoruber]|jgi:hypothetical protein|uniref:hypothetical protein n=1 Tax=Brevibacillus thermoruber TaxID=33942 RepID=UPI000555BD3F|nr:hypothetical protein [Brevibacillus thermoruber]
MKKWFNIFVLFVFMFHIVFPSSAVNAATNNQELMNIPEEVLKEIPLELQGIVKNKQITKKQYEAFLKLKEEESKNNENPKAIDQTRTTKASKVNPKNCQYDLTSNYCFRIDGPEYNGHWYHVHIYKKQTHYYCFRLDTFQECDKNKNQIHSFDDLPSTVKEKIMENKKVQERVLKYNPDAQDWADSIPGIKNLAISVIVVLLVLTPIPGDEYVAWAYFLRAIA